MLPVAHEGVDAVVDREPDQQDRHRHQHGVERHPEPAERPERPQLDEQDARESHEHVQQVPIGQREHDDDQHERDGTQHRERVFHRALLLVGEDTAADDGRLRVCIVAGLLCNLGHRELRVDDALGCSGRGELPVGLLEDGDHGGGGGRRPRFVAVGDEQEGVARVCLVGEHAPDDRVDPALVHPFERGELLVKRRIGQVGALVADRRRRDDVRDASRPVPGQRRRDGPVRPEVALEFERRDQRPLLEDVVVPDDDLCDLAVFGREVRLDAVHRRLLLGAEVERRQPRGLLQVDDAGAHAQHDREHDDECDPPVVDERAGDPVARPIRSSVGRIRLRSHVLAVVSRYSSSIAFRRSSK